MRSDLSTIKIINKWAKSIDFFNVSLLLFLIILGLLFVTTSSPSVAKLKGLGDFYFIKKHYIFVIVSILTVVLFSLFSTSGIIKISYLGLVISLTLISLVLLLSYENNGAVRWINVAGFSLQPTEFLKPFIVIIFSYFLTNKKQIRLFSFYFDGKAIAFTLLLFVSVLVLAQPNYSMFAIIFLVFISQYFISGVNLRWTIIAILSFVLLSVFSYFNLGHVKYRIDSFLNSETVHFQVEKSIKAYKEGGLLGKGPGEGVIKKYIPDSHTDFIFPVIAEEYGAIVCIIVILIVFTIFFRGLFRISKSNDLFKVTACVGLLSLFLIQSLINISVSMKLIPTTGVTFPFISYGGSSLVSMGIVMGMMLSLTKKEFGKKGLIYG
ncbi:FtsW/RodA/SpoVE family cell cycle protein [Alphaproteobacteria bacterium]|nr:FtsW/RodA/SpoVE family cell cycle protein [Alphaproteobacteria bacterium]